MPYHFEQFPPDEGEVNRYVAEKELTVDLDQFYDHYQANGWCDLKGRRLAGWHFALCKVSKDGEWL